VAEKENGTKVKGPETVQKEPCQVAFFLNDEVYQGSTLHFSERGLLVTCGKPAPLNSRLKLVLQFPGFKNTIEVQGEVVWTNVHGAEDSQSPRGMGVKFVNLDREIERLLADMAAKYGAFASIYSCYYT
jgi:Tfp pilus assembly protein PilZ